MPAVLDFVLVLAITVGLFGVVVLYVGKELVEQLDELCGGLVGEARKIEGHDDGVAFHWSSPRAVWRCSEVILV